MSDHLVTIARSDRAGRPLSIPLGLVVLGILLLISCTLRSPGQSTTVSAPPPADRAPVTATPRSLASVDEPSPPGGLGNVVESYSRYLGRPTAAFGVNQPSYAYGDWPVRGTFILLDNNLRRASEVRINFGSSLALADAQARARSYLPVDAKQTVAFVEAGTGDAGVVYTSERLAAAFPTSQPLGQFVVIYDGTGDQVSGLILRMGSADR